MGLVETLKRAGDHCAADNAEVGGAVLVVLDGEAGREVARVWFQRKTRVDDVQVGVEERMPRRVCASPRKVHAGCLS